VYEVQRDLARMNAACEKTAAFAATLLGETFDEADRLAGSTDTACNESSLATPRARTWMPTASVAVWMTRTSSSTPRSANLRALPT